ncbi:permease [Gemmatirosa kalamazoonensis]|uniref:Permease n=1 Tax=Gemmatirosa kalamazoonensis TaxID=861299 RepID=W0RE65_9BACT|nr:ABC transporter permease [Gemmatirosa kalamazoonensis]AHG88620.1 permease [Gemmatirosa kalamazoonensis]
MPLPHGVRRAFRLARRRPPIEQEIDDEVAFHLEMRAAELAARGLTPDDALAEARRRFGDTHHWSVAMSAVDRERVAERGRTEWLTDLRQDLRYGVRALRRTPLFSLLAVVTLALGIGANAAVFGVLKSVLLDALPYADAGRLVRVYARMLDGSMDHAPISAGEITDLRERQRSFSRVASFESQTRDVILEGETGPVVMKMNYTEPALFPTLGVNVARGRVLRDEDAAPDTAFNVVLTHAAWQRLFGGDPRILERPVRINGIPRTVVGVLPRGFVGPVAEADVYFPMRLDAYMRTPMDARRRMNHGLVGRLKPGVTADAANRDVAAIGAALAREYPQFHSKVAVWSTPLRDDMVGDTRTPLLVLMASAGLVLLITCANLAGALLSRTISRRKEFAVRTALGAGRGRLVRQLFTESTLLSLAGGAAGLALASAGLALLRRIAPHVLPAYAELSLDPGAVMVTAAVAVAVGLAFGIAPAVAAGRSNVQGTLRDETRGTSESRRTRTLRGLLVAGQIALCVSLLTGAGLLARTLWAITTRPLGLDPDRVLAVAVQLPRAGFASLDARARFFQQYEERLRALPGVVAAAASGQVPTGIQGRTGIWVDGVRPANEQSVFLLSEVSDDYFRTLRVPLIAGRTFGPEDRPDGATISIIVSERIARQYWPNGGAAGASVRLGPEPDAPRGTVVGVVGDVRNDPAQPEPEGILYMSVRQMPWNGPVFLMRTAGDPLALLTPARRALADIDPRLPLHDPITLRTRLADSLSGKRLPVVLITAFGALALLLASVGVYAMFAAMTAAREKEFGVRVALGSSRARIATLVLRQGGVWMVLGLAGGAVGVVAVSRAVRQLLYGVSPFDPATLAGAALVLLACGAAALLVPVRRATRADPISALR